MGLKKDLEDKVKDIFAEQWSTRDGQKVPSADDLKLSNDAVKLEGVVLYADMSDSTKLVDSKKDWFAAEVYKAYLHCAAKLIRNQGGTITAYDGDRIMAVFIGDSKNTSAAIAALNINHARCEIINPAIEERYGAGTYTVNHTIGIDRSNLFAARTGIRGSNDLVWVGKAANHAAKLGDLSSSYVRVTEEVYDMLNDDAKYSTSGENMWEKYSWTDMERTYYRSSWWRSVS
jgi:class 3 adenylate cyclase